MRQSVSTSVYSRKRNVRRDSQAVLGGGFVWIKHYIKRQRKIVADLEVRARVAEERISRAEELTKQAQEQARKAEELTRHSQEERARLERERLSSAEVEERIRQAEERALKAEALMRQAQEERAKAEADTFSKEYERIQKAIREWGSFEKFANEIYEDRHALFMPVQYQARTSFPSEWTNGLLVGLPYGNSWLNGIESLIYSMCYLLGSKYSKDEIAQFSQNALCSFYDLSKETLLAVGAHLVNHQILMPDELRNLYCGDIMDFRETINKEIRECRDISSSARQEYNATTEILRKAIEAKKGTNQS